MKLSKPRLASAVGFNMTPMIDVVFLLIIFFMTVSQITRLSQQEIQLPLVVRSDDVAESRSVTLIVDKDGKYYWEGVSASLPEIVELVRAAQAQLEADTRLLVNLKCDKRCDSRPVNQVISTLGDLGIKTIRTSIIQQ